MQIWLTKMKPISQRSPTSASGLESKQQAGSALELRDVAAQALRDVTLPELPPWLDAQILSAAQEQAQLQQQRGARSLTRQPWFKFALPAATAAVVLISVYLPTVQVTKQGVALPAEGSLPAASTAGHSAKDPAASTILPSSPLAKEELQEPQAAHPTDRKAISLPKLPDQSAVVAKEDNAKRSANAQPSKELARSEPNFKFEDSSLKNKDQPSLEKTPEKTSIFSSEGPVVASTEKYPAAPPKLAAPQPFPADSGRDVLADVRENKKRPSPSLEPSILLEESAPLPQETVSSRKAETKSSKPSTASITSSAPLAGTISGPEQAQTPQARKGLPSVAFRGSLPEPVQAPAANADIQGKPFSKAFTWEEGFLNEEYFQIRKLLQENKAAEAKNRLKALLKAQPDLVLPHDLKKVVQNQAGEN